MEPKNKKNLYEIVSICEIQENLDKLEGHGAYQTLVFAEDEQLARDISHFHSRNTGRIIKRPAIILPDGQCYLLAESIPIHLQSSIEEAQKNIALAKLTPEEKEMLGIKS